ncbi:hypothetical protein HOY34_13765 [Xinfangfangia sp. D13-10-4-6]|uniref:hypothetical protein n=1 Tax=Pseudogemmobacter hezensis TaxID=2737662 RepID=UPI001554FDA7|nr:hypothetical protein [Pseudogemmobacter hezensis]NPD16262.1 hypothetical protein [Pseudogemmobacter hezensis]
MSETLLKIDLAQGLDGTGNGAFRAEVMAEEGLTNMHLLNYLMNKLGPIASDLGGSLRAGAGFGVICETNADGEFEVSICGLAIPEALNDRA